MKLFGEMISEKKWVNPKKLWDLKSHPRVIPRTRALGNANFIPADKISFLGMILSC